MWLLVVIHLVVSNLIKISIPPPLSLLNLYLVSKPNTDRFSVAYIIRTEIFEHQTLINAWEFGMKAKVETGCYYLIKTLLIVTRNGWKKMGISYQATTYCESVKFSLTNTEGSLKFQSCFRSNIRQLRLVGCP